MTISKTARLGLTTESDNELVDTFPDNWPLLDSFAGALIVANGATPPVGSLFDGSVVAEATSGISWIADLSSGSLVKRYLTYPFEVNCARGSFNVPTGPNANQPIPLDSPAPNGFTNAVSVNWDGDLATTAGRIKVPIAGIYMITAQFADGHSALGARGLYLQTNGVEEIQVIDNAIPSGATAFQAAVIRKLAAGDLIGISFWQNSGVTGAVSFNINVTLASPL